VFGRLLDFVLCEIPIDCLQVKRPLGLGHTLHLPDASSVKHLVVPETKWQTVAEETYDIYTPR
jgi:hypothetical protein